MKKYEVNITSYETGATSPIDVIEERNGYTAEDYLNDCKVNADREWLDLLSTGTITLYAIDQ